MYKITIFTDNLSDLEELLDIYDSVEVDSISDVDDSMNFSPLETLKKARKLTPEMKRSLKPVNVGFPTTDSAS